MIRHLTLEYILQQPDELKLIMLQLVGIPYRKIVIEDKNSVMVITMHLTSGISAVVSISKNWRYINSHFNLEMPYMTFSKTMYGSLTYVRSAQTFGELKNFIKDEIKISKWNLL